MSGVTAIRQRKQWTADLTTLTDGIVEWLDSGLPITATPVGPVQFENEVPIEIAASSIGNSLNFRVDWSSVQNPRYNRLELVYELTFVGTTGASGDVITAQVSEIGVSSDIDTAAAKTMSGTLTITLTPSPRPRTYRLSASFGNVTFGINGTFSGTLTPRYYNA